MTNSPLLEGLNKDQLTAVVHQGSPLLILAGAGSGKTRVITVKIAWLIREQGLDPASILALTFTNKAAQEMRERAALMEPAAKDVMIRTFHSFGAWFLRRNSELAGLSRDFCIYDDEDSLALLATLYPGRNKALLASYAREISRLKDYALGPDDLIGRQFEQPDLPEVYFRYQERLAEIGNCDFGDLIIKPLQVLKENPELARRFHGRFSVILVDEYQDSNIAQYELLKVLKGPETLLGVVGDDDQSIYRFRGAEVKNILSFSEVFEATKIIRLEQNYRSTNPILRLADAAVSKNTERLGKHLWTERQDGELPLLCLFTDQDEELEFLTSYIQKNGSKDMALLYRTNSQSRAFETALLNAGIPYRIVGSVRFYEREEIKDSLAFLRFISNPRDEVAFRRIVNKPARGLGKLTLNTLILDGLLESKDFLELSRAKVSSLSKKARQGLKAFLDICDTVTALLNKPSDEQDARKLGAFVEACIEQSGLKNLYKEEDEIHGSQKQQNLEELINAASLFELSREGLSAFLESLELDSARENSEASEDAVTLITMHNTKGLEFETVFISGLEDELFPRNPDDADELEEERRLFYVALTRAKSTLILSSCAWRRINGRLKNSRASVFLRELPQDLYELKKFAYSAQDLQNSSYGVSGAYGSRNRIGGFQKTASDWNDDVSKTFSDEYAVLKPRPVWEGGGRKKKALASWPLGSKVYHDDYGAGYVTKSWIEEDDEVVIVQFETGRSARFIPRYSMLEKLSNE